MTKYKSITAREIMFAALERVLKCLIRNYNIKVTEAKYKYENELYELKYSFLKNTLENVTCVTPCKAKKKFQTSHFVAGGLFLNFIYLIGDLITFVPILMGLIISFVIIHFVEVPNVTGCYSVTPPLPDC